ncbi:hypothetical protein QTP88_005559 [Uroleucon formosanum]
MVTGGLTLTESDANNRVDDVAMITVRSIHLGYSQSGPYNRDKRFNIRETGEQHNDYYVILPMTTIMKSALFEMAMFNLISSFLIFNLTSQSSYLPAGFALVISLWALMSDF